MNKLRCIWNIILGRPVAYRLKLNKCTIDSNGVVLIDNVLEQGGK